MNNKRPDHLQTTPWLDKGDDGVKEVRDFMASRDAENRKLSDSSQKAIPVIEAGKRKEFNIAEYQTLSLEELEKIHNIFGVIKPEKNVKNKTAQEIVKTLSDNGIQTEAINNSQNKLKIAIGERIYAGYINEFYSAFFFYEKKKHGKK
jgi:aspartokinase